MMDKNCEKHAAIPLDPQTFSIQRNRQPENNERLRVLLGDAGIFSNANIRPHLKIVNCKAPAIISDILRVHDYSYISDIIYKCEKVPANVLPIQYGTFII